MLDEVYRINTKGIKDEALEVNLLEKHQTHFEALSVGVIFCLQMQLLVSRLNGGPIGFTAGFLFVIHRNATLRGYNKFAYFKNKPEGTL